MKNLRDPLRHVFPSKSLTISTLPNGLRVATDSFPSADVTICVGVDVGSRFDPDDAQGMVSLITRRAETCRELAAMGRTSGGLDKERFHVYVTVPKAKMLTALKILAHSVQDSAFDDGVIETDESYKMFSGLNEALKETHQLMFNELYATAFPTSPLGRIPFVLDDNIGTMMTKEHLKNFISQNFTAPRMVISVTGDVNHADIIWYVKKFFTKLSDNPGTGSQLVSKAPATFTGSEVRIKNDELPFAHVAVAFGGASRTDSDRVALMVIKKMFGSSNHIDSEQAQIIDINKRDGIVKAFNANYHEIGVFGVCVKAKPYCLDGIATKIMSSFSKLCSLVLEQDVFRAKEKLKISLLMKLNSRPLAPEITEDLLIYGRKITVEERLASIDAVDADTVKRVAKRFFFDQDIAISALGPIAKLPDYEWFRSRTRVLYQ